MTLPPTAPAHQRVQWQGLTCHELTLPDGDSVRVSEHGAHVLSWLSLGREQLYLSPLSVLDGRAAIRGGIPVCWPQFSGRGPLPRHGWVRQSGWRPLRVEPASASIRLVLGINPSPPGPAEWSQDCRLELAVTLQPGGLDVSLTVVNEGPDPLSFTGALHTYLSLDDARCAEVSGWPTPSERTGWDSVLAQPCETVPRLGLQGEIDRILPGVPQLTVCDGSRRVWLSQDGWAETVVWNPGADKCRQLRDMPDDDHLRMACVEAAQALSPALVPPHGVWVGTQRLRVGAPT